MPQQYVMQDYNCVYLYVPQKIENIYIYVIHCTKKKVVNIYNNVIHCTKKNSLYLTKIE
jgi:hypothetical protein